MYISPECDMKRWEVIPTSVIVDADNYYTKSQVNALLAALKEEIINELTPDEEVDDEP